MKNKSNSSKSWKNVKPEYSINNPKLDFFGNDGKYLYSSNFYKNIPHAWANVAQTPYGGKIVYLIERSKQNAN